MSKKVGIIGHVDHGKTTLSSAIASVIASKGLEAISKDELKEEVKERDMSIQEAIEKDKSYKITIPPGYFDEYEIKDGKQSRRERRAKARKNK